VRYSEFKQLHDALCTCFATLDEARARLPSLPKKTWSSSSAQQDEGFINRRKEELNA
jgi:hypothetical protein